MAEAYVRTRDMDYLEASLNRSARIEQYVKAFAQQLIPAVKKISVLSQNSTTQRQNTAKQTSLSTMQPILHQPCLTKVSTHLKPILSPAQ